MILVTVGTEQYPFNALMDWVDLLIRDELIDKDEEVIVQYGSSSKLPDKVKIFKRLPESEFKALLEKARVVISHCGEGSAMLLESLGKPYILVPRTQRFGEHVDNHQIEMADAMEKQGISIARSPADLVKFLAAPKVSSSMSHSEEKLCNFLSNRYNCNQYKKIMVVCSSGGHFKYAQSLKPFLEQSQDISWVTFKTPDTESKLKTEKSVYWAHSPTNRNLPNLIRNLILAFKVLNQEQPDLVLSTGAGLAVAFLFVAQFLYKKKAVFIESKTRLKDLSLSAKILYYTSQVDQLIVRSKDIEKKYEKTKYIGISTAASTTLEDKKNQSNTLKVNETGILSVPIHFGVLEAPQFKNDFQELCELAPKKIVIDMSATRFITSIGLGVLVSVFKTSRLKGIELVFWSVNPEVMSVLSMARLDNLFSIEAATSAIRTKWTKKNAKSQRKLETRSTSSSIQRAIDVAAALVGLGITAPLFIPISIGIKLTSPGPIFTEEARYGLMGKYFQLRKFRSMVTQANHRDDSPPKLTKFGYILRKTNLDKLPLLWNLLMGDMSLVGPRASTVEDLDFYSTNEWQALEVKPGVFSEWELHYRDRQVQSCPSSSPSVTPINSQPNHSELTQSLYR
ncbi:MAG TPA: sugar transferase [Waterburya sp.]|jgi:anti-anti-sigma factor